MPFRPVLDALNNAASYQSRDMFQYNPTPPGTGTAIANAAGASTPPLGMAPNKGVLGGTTMPVNTPLATMVQAATPLATGMPNVTPQNLQSSLYAQQQGRKAGLLQGPMNLAGAVQNAQQTGYAKSLWQPGGGGRR